MDKTDYRRLYINGICGGNNTDVIHARLGHRREIDGAVYRQDRKTAFFVFTVTDWNRFVWFAAAEPLQYPAGCFSGIDGNSYTLALSSDTVFLCILSATDSNHAHGCYIPSHIEILYP